jgi:hypothetical protein
MAKMSKEVRRQVFEGAMEKLYGYRFEIEGDLFEEGIIKCAEGLARRKAVECGVEYDLLVGKYAPYTVDSNGDVIEFRDNACRERFQQILFNECKSVLKYEDADIYVHKYYLFIPYHLRTQESHPFPRNDSSMDEICEEELATVFERYAAFMDEAIGSACVIRDVINSATTIKQLEETAPELAEFIPSIVGCEALVPVETVRKLNALFAESKGNEE